MNKLKQNRSYKKKCSLKTRIVSIFLTICFMLLSGCSISGAANYVPSVSSDEKDSRPLVVTTIFPYYDFVRQIAGNRVRLKMVVPAGMDSHSFEPTPADMITMQQADLMVCNGGEMEQWVEKVTASLDTENMKILTMMDYVDVLEEETVEGMEDTEHSHEDHDHAHGQSEEDHIHDYDEKKAHEDLSQITFNDHDGHEMDIEYDEHIWTSPANAMKLVEVITEILKEVSPENAPYFEENKNSYEKELKNRLKTCIRNGEAARYQAAEISFGSFGQLTEYIREKHAEYLKKERNISDDIRYILDVCCQVFRGVCRLCPGLEPEKVPVCGF